MRKEGSGEGIEREKFLKKAEKVRCGVVAVEMRFVALALADEL
jgi:hypothetical protein